MSRGRLVDGAQNSSCHLGCRSHWIDDPYPTSPFARHCHVDRIHCSNQMKHMNDMSTHIALNANNGNMAASILYLVLRGCGSISLDRLEYPSVMGRLNDDVISEPPLWIDPKRDYTCFWLPIVVHDTESDLWAFYEPAIIRHTANCVVAATRRRLIIVVSLRRIGWIDGDLRRRWRIETAIVGATLTVNIIVPIIVRRWPLHCPSCLLDPE